MMAYNSPETVVSPRGSWLLIDVLADFGEDQHALALGEWHGGGPAHGQRVLAMRWNGNDEHPGHPQSRGTATWFIVPPVYNAALVDILPEGKRIIARVLLGLEHGRPPADTGREPPVATPSTASGRGAGASQTGSPTPLLVETQPDPRALYVPFWEQLAERASRRPEHPFRVTARSGYYTGSGTGVGGVDLNYVILRDRARVHLFIHNGGDDGRARNRAIFDTLAADRHAIESAYGSELEWITPKGRIAAYGVQRWIELGGLDDRDHWADIQEAMIDAMIRLEQVMRPYLGRVREAR
jgi:hypothetical protein